MKDPAPSAHTYSSAARPVPNTCLCCILKVMEKLVKRDSGSGGFSALMSAVLEKYVFCHLALSLLLGVSQRKRSRVSWTWAHPHRSPLAILIYKTMTMNSLHVSGGSGEHVHNTSGSERPGRFSNGARGQSQ